MNLYKITGQALQLQEMIGDPEVDEDTLLDTMESVEGDFNDKIQAYCFIIKNMEPEAQAAKEEASRLSTKARSIENKIKSLKARMLEAMEATGVSEAGGDKLKAKIAKNGGKVPLLYSEGVTPEEVPSEFVITNLDFDGEKIREALDKGEKLGFVRYGERGEHINIK